MGKIKDSAKDQWYRNNPLQKVGGLIYAAYTIKNAVKKKLKNKSEDT